jgi:hypothetical protein
MPMRLTLPIRVAVSTAAAAVAAYSGVAATHPGVSELTLCAVGVHSAGTHGKEFDPQMSAVCRFSCAANIAYEAKDVVAQPGVGTDQLAQCPVSGVVFVADRDRPRVRVAAGEYVFCCDKCAEKFRATPGRFVSL